MRLTKKLPTLAVWSSARPCARRCSSALRYADDLPIDLLGKQQRDIDVDALAQELAGRRKRWPGPGEP